VEVPGQDMHESGTGLIAGFWSSEIDEGLLGMLTAIAAMPGGDIVRGSLVHLLARLGRIEDLRAFLAQVGGYEPEPSNWSSTADEAAYAEVAVALDDVAMARRAHDLLVRWEGRMVVAGISIIYGPVDGYLAVLEAFLGDREAAGAHADAALAVARAEGWGLYVSWLERYRASLGF
jgi:hypothetical protein